MGLTPEGGSFVEAEREAAALAREASRARRAAQQFVAGAERTEREQRRVEQRVRAAATASVARIEGRTTEAQARVGPDQQRAIAAQRREMDSLTRSSREALRPIEQMRRIGPFAFSRSAQAAQQLNEQIGRIQTTARAALGGFAVAGGGAGAPPGRPPIGFGGGQPPGWFYGGGGGPPAGAGGGAFGQAGPGVDELARRQQQFRSELSRTAAAHFSASNAMRRHGALSTEFFDAVIRGEASLRELGWQLGATTAKFGGWLAAGALVYGTARGLGTMARGALDAAHGVTQLQLVIDDLQTEGLMQEFGDLADRFNLSIDQITDSAFQMGKIFHDQEQALTATEATLFAQTIGELDPDEATRHMVAIANAFGFGADELIRIMDQLNEAQQRFGSQIPETLRGISRSAGAFVAAGGTGAEGFSELLSIIATVQRAAGLTGEVVGTALARAPRFFRSRESRAVFGELGIPEQAQENVVDLLREAFAIAPDLSGERLQSLATAIFGSQRGQQVGIPLLQQTDLLEQIRLATDADAAAGSAAQEHERLLTSIQQRVAAVGVGLEELGTNLYEAGFFDLMGATVMLMNELLDVATLVVSQINELPEGLRKALVIGGQLLVLMRLFQRMGFVPIVPPISATGQQQAPGPVRAAAAGVLFPGGAQGVSDRALARSVRSNIQQQFEGAVQRREALTQQAQVEARNATTYGDMAVQSRREVAILRQRGADTAAIAQAEQRVVDAQSRALLHAGRRDAITREQAFVAQDIARNERQLAQIRGRFGRLNTQAALAIGRQQGLFIAPGLERPSSAQPVPVPGAPGAGPGAGQVIIPPGTLRPDTSAAVQAWQQQSRQAEQALQGEGRRFSRGWQAGWSRVSRGLGVLGNLMFAGFITYTVADLVTNFWENQANRIEELQADLPATVEAAQERARQATEQLADSGEPPWWVRSNQFIRPAYELGRRVVNPFEEQERQVAEQIDAEQRLRLRTQRDARARGVAVPLLFAEQIDQDIRAIREYERGSDEWRDAIERAEEQIRRRHPSVTEEQAERFRNRLQRMIASAGAAGENVTRLLGDINVSTEKLDEAFGREAARFELRRGGGQTLSRLSAAYEQRRIRAQDEGPEALLQAREDFYNAIEQLVQSELDSALALARDPGERNEAYRDALSTLQEAIDERESLVERRQQAIQRLRRRVRSARGARDTIARRLLSGVADPQDWSRLQARLEEHQRRLRGAQQELEDAERREREFRLEIQRQRFEERLSRSRARADLAASRVADPLAQAARTIRRVNRNIDEAIRLYGRGSEQVLGLLQERSEAINQRLQEQVALIQSRGALRTAGIDPENSLARLRSDLTTARDVLAFMQSNRGRFSMREIIDQHREIRELEWRITEEMRREAEELAELQSLRFDIRAAQAEAAGDDIRVAAIRVREALYNLQQADTPADRLRARAALIRARTARRDAIFRTEVEDIQFQADIGRLTLQQQIREYQRLLRTMELTRDMRRELRRRIHQLREQAESEAGQFDLSVGDIKLPTIYEIRRALRGQTVSQAPQVNIRQTNNYTANGANADDIVRQWTQQQGDAARRAASMARSAGIR